MSNEPGLGIGVVHLGLCSRSSLPQEGCVSPKKFRPVRGSRSPAGYRWWPSGFAGSRPSAQLPNSDGSSFLEQGGLGDDCPSLNQSGDSLGIGITHARHVTLRKPSAGDKARAAVPPYIILSEILVQKGSQPIIGLLRELDHLGIPDPSIRSDPDSDPDRPVFGSRGPWMADPARRQ